MIVIKNATLFTMESINGENGYVAFKNGKIEKTGRTFSSDRFKEYTVIDAKGAALTPGLVEAHCHVGIAEEGIMFEGNDLNETTDPVYPELRGLDSVNPRDKAFETTAASGVTTVVSGPGSANIIGGTFAAMKTIGDTAEQMVFVEETAMKMALGENPKRVYSGQKRSPSTRMANAAILREWLHKAKEYHEEWRAFDAGKADKPAFNMKLHSLKRVFEGMPVKIHAHRSDDIMTAIRIVKEFDLDATIEHATEAHLIPKSVKESGIPVILGPTLGARGKYETSQRTFQSAAILDKHEVPFSIMTDHPVVTTDNILVQAALFVKSGLSRQKALEAITINAARLSGIDDRVGSIAPGKDADLVLWDGDPFDIMTRPKTVYIEGKALARFEGGKHV